MEENRKPRVCYARTTDGVELPVVDVTHPAFALVLTDSEQRALVEKFLREGGALAKLPKPVRNFVLRLLLRGSVLADGIDQARGTFMSGMHTYLLKLGPEMLGSASANPIDRKIAASLPVLGVRLRLQDMARLMAGALEPSLLAAASRPLRFLNIAGGPAIDSLNALIVLTKEHPGILSGRSVAIDVLDRDTAGPAFGQAALEALSAEGAPLAGLRIDFRHVPYDWARTDDLHPVLDEARGQDAIAIVSSEGGLFEYGSDSDIESNLRVLRASAAVVAVAGSVTRADNVARRFLESSSAAVYPRGLTVFRALAQRAGWDVARAIERPFSDQVLLT